jgi:predicted RNase H-related nuclease YkuK (DUF458 family)
MKKVKNSIQWFSPSSGEVFFDDLLPLLKLHTKESGTIFVGTDSFITKDQCTFARAICLHGGNSSHSGKYFFARTKENLAPFKLLVTRMIAEVEKTVETALKISEQCPGAKIEIHLDISNSPEKGATGKYADMLKGYAKSSGFPYKVKPESWASSSVADKHSK